MGRNLIPKTEESTAVGELSRRSDAGVCRHGEALLASAPYGTRRTRQLLKGAPSLVHSKNKPIVTALREIADQKVYFARPVKSAVEEYIAETKANDSSL